MSATAAKPILTIPETSDYYRLQAMGRRAIPDEAHKQIFVTAWQRADVVERDYRELTGLWITEAGRRGFHIDSSTSDEFLQCSELWKKVTFQTSGGEICVSRYADVFVAAILQCKITGVCIYE